MCMNEWLMDKRYTPPPAATTTNKISAEELSKNQARLRLRKNKEFRFLVRRVVQFWRKEEEELEKECEKWRRSWPSTSVLCVALQCLSISDTPILFAVLFKLFRASLLANDELLRVFLGAALCAPCQDGQRAERNRNAMENTECNLSFYFVGGGEVANRN